jgi:hypothetical protein
VPGALVGTVMGRMVVRVHEGVRSRPSRAQITFTPAFAPGFQGITFTARF